jgi:hypothetical protein
MATTTSGGKTRGPSSPRQIGQAGQALVEEAFAPFGDDLSRRVQACGDLVVAQAFGRVEHDPGPHNILYAQPMDTEQMRDFAAEPNRRDPAGAIVELRSSSPNIAAIAGTRWAAYNAVTEYVDHYNAVRKGADERTARALRAVTIGSTA